MSLQKPSGKLPSTVTFLINSFAGWEKYAVGEKSQLNGFCRMTLDVRDVVVPAPLKCHSLSGLHWDGDSLPQIMQLCSCLTELRLHRGKIITTCPEHTRNLWQRNKILPEIIMAETSFFPSVLIFRLLHSPFLSFTLIITQEKLSCFSGLSSSYSCLIAIFCYAGH